VTIWIATVMFKSNDILRKQTALKVSDCFVELLVQFYQGLCCRALRSKNSFCCMPSFSLEFMPLNNYVLTECQCSAELFLFIR